MRRNRSIRVFGTMLLLFVLATATYAFTAANTVDPSNAGIGGDVVDGYVVTDIAYTFAEDDAETVASVSFSLDADAGSVLARVNGTAGTWVTCTEAVADSGDWSCPINASTLAIVNLEIAAAS